MSLPFYFEAAEGPELPLLVSVPHTGTEVPPEIAARFASAEVSALPDTDWHLQRLYDFVPRLGARLLCARYSRYVIDLNRAPDSAPLYPGRFETTLVPTRTFQGGPIYAPGAEPTPDEVRQRLGAYWEPYHARLTRELAELKQRHGYALLWDAHSIRTQVPLLFEGSLPALVLGDALGHSAHPALSKALLTVFAESPYPHSHNHPFRGGYITRQYGKPYDGVHALQLEMARATYMSEDAPFAYDLVRASQLAETLRAALTAYAAAAQKRL